MKLLVIDTETGGLDPSKHSLLSWAGVVWRDGRITDSLELFIREPSIRVERTAMKINKIDLNFIREHGVSPRVAVNEIERFVSNNFDENRLFGGTNRIALAGQNVGFDVAFTKRLYRQARRTKDYEKRFSHRTLDTAGIMRFLYLQGKLPFWDASLDAGLKHFNVQMPRSERHSALGDALGTAKLLTALVRDAK